MKYILLLLPFFINAQIINIQGSVNSNDGPLGFATVSILDTSYGVTSNENGYFEIQVDSSIEVVLQCLNLRWDIRHRFFASEIFAPSLARAISSSV